MIIMKYEEKQLTIVMDRRKLTRNEKSPTAMARDFKSVVSGFDGPDTDRSIFHISPISVNHNQNLIHTVARYAMSLRFNCACLSKKHIIKLLTYKGLTPRTGRQSYWNRVWIWGNLVHTTG